MLTKIAPFVLTAAVFAIPQAVSATTLVNFESFAAMPNSPGSAVPVASQLGTQLLPTLGVKFASGAPWVAVVNHVPGCAVCTPTPPNIIGGTNANGGLDYSAAIVASFFDPSNTSSKATTNFVRVLGDQFPLGSGTVYLEAFGTTGNFLGSVSAPDVGPQGTGVTLTANFAGIHSVRFFSDNATVGFDNFEFGPLRFQGGAVPEPATWAMMIGASAQPGSRCVAADVTGASR